MTELRKCHQCWVPKPWPEAFIGKRGQPVQSCQACQKKYGNWESKTIGERLAGMTPRQDAAPRGRMLLMARSHNVKTGPMPVSISERGTCPPSCSMFDAGCYAGYSHLGSHWRGTGRSHDNWMPWEAFLDRVRAFPEGTVWRHNEAGDLAGEHQDLDIGMLAELVAANSGRRGFTFTHKTQPENREWLRAANAEGFTINLSADSLEEADCLAGHGSPVVVILDAQAPHRLRTPAGHHVVLCPAQTEALTCVRCQLCAKPQRKAIVGFRVHGRGAGLIPELVRRRRAGVQAVG